jgi:uncharacterized protein (TIGR00106 family)
MMLQNNYKVNIAIQVLPLVTSDKVFDIVDKAIECIKKSGVKHVVSPFETIMEGNLDDLLEIVKDVQRVCFDANSDELIINMKVHSNRNQDVLIEQKMKNYQ